MPTGPRPDPPNRSCKLVFAGNYNATQWANVMWLTLNGSGVITHADLLSLAGSASSLYGTHMMALQNNASLFSFCQAVLYFNGDVFDAVVTPATAGAQSGGITPASASCCITWRIASHYRGGHPRTYLPGQDRQNLANASTWTGAFLSSAQSHAASFHNGLESLGPIGSGITTVEHGIVSFVHNKAWRTPPIFRRITDVSVDSRVDTQRRRLGRDRAV